MGAAVVACVYVCFGGAFYGDIYEFAQLPNRDVCVCVWLRSLCHLKGMLPD